MADQSINISINGKLYPFKVSSPESEQLIRMAADSVNAMLNTYGTKYPQASAADKLAFVSVFESMRCLVAQKNLASGQKEVKILEEEIDKYLSGK